MDLIVTNVTPIVANKRKQTSEIRQTFYFFNTSLYGVFGFILLDTKARQVFIGRDTFGVRPVFHAYSERTGTLSVCSEAKGLTKVKTKDLNGNLGAAPPIVALPPGTYAQYSLAGKENRCEFVAQKRFHVIGAFPKYDVDVKLTGDYYENIRNCLGNAVRVRMMAERRIGCLLSGGVSFLKRNRVQRVTGICNAFSVIEK